MMAERITQLGGTARGTVQEVNRETQLPTYPTDIYRINDHIHALIERYSMFANAVRKNIDDTDDAGDVGTSDLLTEVSRGVDKQLWFPRGPRAGAEQLPAGRRQGEGLTLCLSSPLPCGRGRGRGDSEHDHRRVVPCPTHSPPLA